MASPRINAKSAQMRLPATAQVSSLHVARKGAWGRAALRSTCLLLYVIIGRNNGAEAGTAGAALKRHPAPLALARPLPVPSHSASFPGRGSVMQLTVKKDSSNSRTTTEKSSRVSDLSSASTFSPAATLSSVAAAAAAVVGRFTSPSTTSQSSSYLEESLLSSSRKVESSPYVSVEIRKPLIDELVSVVDLRLEVFCGQKYAAAHPEARERSLRQLVSRQRKGSTCLVASARDALDPSAERGTVVGSLELSTHEFAETNMSPSCDTTVPKLYVTEMAVSEGFRRRGVASGLLKAVDEHAKELGIPFICLFVETKNRSAIELYLKAGYHLVPFSPQAVAFASAIGLYSGALASREYYFCYKRLPIAQAAPAPSMPVTLVGAGMERSVYGPARLAM